MSRLPRRYQGKEFKEGSAKKIRRLIQLGLENHKTGHLKQAKQAYEKALRLDPLNARALFLRGTLATQEQEYVLAETLVGKAITRNPQDPTYRNNLGVILRKLGRLKEAVIACQYAIDLAPKYAEAYANMAVVLRELGQFSEALDHVDQALSLAPGMVGAHLSRANVLHALGRWQEARETYNQIVAVSPKDPTVYFSRAVALQEMGLLDLARADLKTVLKLQPANGEAWRLLSALTGGEKLSDQDVKAMMKLIQELPADSENIMHLYFAVGKAFEDNGQFSEAFSHYHQANQLYRSAYEYDIQRDVVYFNSIKRIFSQDFLMQRTNWGQKFPRPIFIIGMMRSGTSLVEQILASHSEVAAGGELKELDRMVRRQDEQTIDVQFPNSVVKYDSLVVKQLADTYISALVNKFGHARRFTDKMPGNFIYVGLIRLLFPNAIVVHCVRNPFDTCVSCFRNYFSGLHPYAYDLEELGKYYNLYIDLMDHWRRTIPGFVHDFCYEDLVGEPERQTKTLLEICGLKWDEKCLEFHNTKRQVRTASAYQVRQPIYRTSVKGWKNFEKHLGSLKKILKYSLTD